MLTVAMMILVLSLMLMIMSTATRWYQINRSAFKIVLLTGVVLGISAYWLRSASYHESLTVNWFQIDNLKLTLSLVTDTTVAYLIGFWSLFVLILWSAAPTPISHHSFTQLMGLYTLYVGLILAGDVLTLLATWAWGIALLAILFRTPKMVRHFSPWLGGGLLFLVCISLISQTNQTLLPNSQLAVLLPDNVVTGIGGLIITTVLIQTCQLPFPLWMEVASEEKSDWLTETGAAVSMVMGSGILLWKFAALLQPLHAIILTGCGVLTLLWNFYRLYQAETPPHLTNYLFINGLVGGSLIGILASPSPILIQLISLLPIILLTNTLQNIPTFRSPSSASSGVKDKIGLVVIILLITGVPLTISYNLRLSLLEQFVSGQNIFTVKWVGISLWVLHLVLTLAITIRWLQAHHQQVADEKAAIANPSPSWSRVALGLNVLMLLYLCYPLPLANHFRPNMGSIFHLPAMCAPAASSTSTANVQLNLLVLIAWILPLLGIYFFHQRLVFKPSRANIAQWFYDGIVIGIDWLSMHLAEWSEGFHRMWINLKQKMMLFFQHKIKNGRERHAVTAEISQQPESDNQSPIGRLRSKRLSWLMVILVLVVLGLVLFFLIKG